jgi:hypothetical protein
MSSSISRAPLRSIWNQCTRRRPLTAAFSTSTRLAADEPPNPTTCKHLSSPIIRLHLTLQRSRNGCDLPSKDLSPLPKHRHSLPSPLRTFRLKQPLPLRLPNRHGLATKPTHRTRPQPVSDRHLLQLLLSSRRPLQHPLPHLCLPSSIPQGARRHGVPAARPRPRRPSLA